MSESTKYRQCTLKKTLSEFSSSQLVSYIPEKYAELGRTLKLKNDHDEWEDGWVVIAAGRLTDSPPDSHQGIKQHRKNTGDSLRKPESVQF